VTLLGAHQPPPRRREPILFVAALALVLAVAAGALLYFYFRWSAARTAVRPTPSATRPPATAPAAPAATARTEPSARPTPRPRPTKAPVAPAPRAPRLRVESDVPGASVFVDRRFVGKAPVDITDVTPGTHRINVSADGYEMQAEDVDLRDEAVVLSVRFKEVRLDETLEVVHKHGMGSCRGRLRATPQGISFEAEKDSFSAPLADIERFEVDYLKKNLRLSLRGGRTYNFTTDASSADPLLAFKQKVAAAQARLVR
jgi:hypothetical protein